MGMANRTNQGGSQGSGPKSSSGGGRAAGAQRAAAQSGNRRPGALTAKGAPVPKGGGPGRTAGGGSNATASSGGRARPGARQPSSYGAFGLPAQGILTGKRLGIGATALVLVAALVVIIVSVTGGSGSSNVPPLPANPSAKLLSEVTSGANPTSALSTALNKVGAGNGSATPPYRLTGQPPLTAAGKPEVVYLGAEYCPFCAAERWALVVALSRFGTFTGLQTTESSLTDVYPGTKTWTFAKATYASPYVDFSTTETCTNRPAPTTNPTCGTYIPLQKPSASVLKLVGTYDSPPYVSSSNAGAIPFVDLGNRYLQSGAQYNPGDLTGLTHSQIAASLTSTSSIPAQAIDSAANYITAAVCSLDGGKPGNVCDSPGVKAASRSLAKAPLAKAVASGKVSSPGS